MHTAAALAPLAFDLLNAVSAHIAVVDERGAIVAVNEPWRRFCAGNGGRDEACGVGADYLAACEAGARGPEGESAAALRDGIGALLAAEGAPFAIEYPCHSPEQPRWFRVQVTRFVHEGRVFVALVHEDITARRQAREVLRAAQATLEALLERERHAARTDELTGLRNRRHFFELAEPMVAAARRYGTPLCLVMLDIDRFKAVNDRLGHQAGDAILRDLAGVAARQVRAADVLARYGGEEFVLALPSTGKADALGVAEKIRRSVEAAEGLGGQPGLRITVSAGVAELAAADATLDDLIRRGDAALYRAKESGRNRSVAA